MKPGLSIWSRTARYFLVLLVAGCTTARASPEVVDQRLIPEVVRCLESKDAADCFPDGALHVVVPFDELPAPRVVALAWSGNIVRTQCGGRYAILGDAFLRCGEDRVDVFFGQDERAWLDSRRREPPASRSDLIATMLLDGIPYSLIVGKTNTDASFETTRGYLARHPPTEQICHLPCEAAPPTLQPCQRPGKLIALGSGKVIAIWG